MHGPLSISGNHLFVDFQEAAKANARLCSFSQYEGGSRCTAYSNPTSTTPSRDSSSAPGFFSQSLIKIPQHPQEKCYVITQKKQGFDFVDKYINYILLLSF
jgi:hypothetical protein